MKILLITDTQLGMAEHCLKGDKWTTVAKNWLGDNLELGQDKEDKNFSKFVEIADREKPSFVVHCGDIVNDINDTVSILKVKKHISLLENISPVYILPGNHDVGIDPEVISADGLKIYKENFGNDYSSYRKDNFLFLFINSSLFMNPEILIDDYHKQIDFIKEELRKIDTNYKVVVFTHHPPYVKRIDMMENQLSDLTSDRDLGYWMFPEEIKNEFFMLFKNTNLVSIFCGHLHTNLYSEYKNTEVVVTSALGLPLGSHPSGYRIINIDNRTLGHEFKSVT